jgi:citrate/tricarballylate utilization protein
VPRSLAQIRAASYEQYCWPRPLAAAFRRHGVLTGVALAVGLIVVMLAAAWSLDPELFWRADPSADFYAVIPHELMAGLFGGVSLFVVAAGIVGLARFWKDIGGGRIELPPLIAARRALADAFALRHMHGAGVDCASGEETRSPWRRRFHHCTAYGFLLCFLSTSVASIYHSVFGWRAPYGYTSLPVIFGVAGGVGLLIGPAGLLFGRRRRDPALGAPVEQGLDVSFIVLLFLTSLTGMLLLALREQAAMPLLLVVHLAVVFGLFLTLPYGKFVHGVYRTAALIKDAQESAIAERESAAPETAVALLPARGRHADQPRVGDDRAAPVGGTR